MPASPTVPPQGAGGVDGGGILGSERRALSVGIITVVLLIAFEATAVGTAMPVAARDLDGVSLYAFAFSAYFTTSLFGDGGQRGSGPTGAGRSGPLGVGISGFAAGLVLSRDRAEHVARSSPAAPCRGSAAAW